MEAGWVTQRVTVADFLHSFQVSPYPDQDPTDAGTLPEYGPRKIICLEQNELLISISKTSLEA